MQISQTYIAVAVTLFAPLLPKLGLNIGSEELTTTITTLVAFAGAVWALIRRYQAGGIISDTIKASMGSRVMQG